METEDRRDNCNSFYYRQSPPKMYAFPKKLQKQLTHGPGRDLVGF